MSNAAKPAAAPPKKGRRTLPLILGSIVVLAVGGGGYRWWARQQVATAATSEHPGAEGDHGAASQTKNPEHAALLSLDSFTVNLADTEATRFLRTNVQLVLAVEEDVIEELEHEKLPIMRARSAVLELLAQQKSTALTTPEGKDALKKTIAERASKALHHEVSDVLFSDFVIQF